MKAGLSLRGCVRQLYFSPAAIQKEIERNGSRDSYLPSYAHRRYLELRKAANQCHRILGRDPVITEKVMKLLHEDWSPEQIAVRLFKVIPKSPKYAITYDNGREFAEHELTEKQTQTRAYFAHSWERETNENTNRLTRRYFPQGTVFSKIDLTYFNQVIDKLNHRPRKRLGYRTPFEVFYGVNFRVVM